MHLMNEPIPSIRHQNEILVPPRWYKVIVNIEAIVIIDRLAHRPIKEGLASEILLDDNEDFLFVILLQLELIELGLIEGLDPIGIEFEQELDDLLHSEKSPLGAGAQDVGLACLKACRTGTVPQKHVLQEQLLFNC